MAMGNVRRIAAMACVLWLAAGGFGAIAGESGEPRFDDLRWDMAGLREEVTAGAGPYGSMSTGDRETLLARQDELLDLIEAIATGGEPEVVCEYGRRAGTHRKDASCTTLAERQAQRDTARRSMDNVRRVCDPFAGRCL